MQNIKMFNKKMIFPLIVSVFLLIVPTILIKLAIIDAYFAQIITLAAINAIMAISVNIICGFTGQLSLGQASFMAIGAYMSILLTEILGLPMGLSIILAGFSAAFVGFLIGFPTLKLRGDY
ncbi:MAG TPA: branched-chain amino acid ABC transporter permease, partial [Treponemataceae bacterium]|nr:branched-chain amino acid ABC transporter permease [Treponemataceae bacterium]